MPSSLRARRRVYLDAGEDFLNPKGHQVRITGS